MACRSSVDFLKRSPKKMKKPRFTILRLVGVFVAIYTLGPIIAGYFAIGNRQGPYFYPVRIHSTLYIIAHESRTGIKPRIGFWQCMYERPYFYGMSPRPKSSAERQVILKRAEDRGSGILERLREINSRIEGEQGGETDS